MSHNNRSSAPARNATQDITVIKDDLNEIKSEIITSTRYLREIRDNLEGSCIALEVPLLDGSETEELYLEWQDKMQHRLLLVMEKAEERGRISYIASRTTGAAYRELHSHLYPNRPPPHGTGFGNMRDTIDTFTVLRVHNSNAEGRKTSFA